MDAVCSARSNFFALLEVIAQATIFNKLSRQWGDGIPIGQGALLGRTYV